MIQLTKVINFFTILMFQVISFLYLKQGKSQDFVRLCYRMNSDRATVKGLNNILHTNIKKAHLPSYEFGYDYYSNRQKKIQISYGFRISKLFYDIPQEHVRITDVVIASGFYAPLFKRFLNIRICGEIGPQIILYKNDSVRFNGFQELRKLAYFKGLGIEFSTRNMTLFKCNKLAKHYQLTYSVKFFCGYNVKIPFHNVNSSFANTSSFCVGMKFGGSIIRNTVH